MNEIKSILERLLIRSRTIDCPVPGCNRRFDTPQAYYSHISWHIRKWKKLAPQHKGLSPIPCPVCGRKVQWRNPYVLDKLTPYHAKCWFKAKFEERKRD